MRRVQGKFSTQLPWPATGSVLWILAAVRGPAHQSWKITSIPGRPELQAVATSRAGLFPR